MQKIYYHYFVEGETEKKIVETLKTDFQFIHPGKVQVLNPLQEQLNMRYLRVLKRPTDVIFVFDTDQAGSGYLKNNIELLKKQSVVRRVICIPQVETLEDELIKSCSIKQIEQLTGSKSRKDFKGDFIKCSNPESLLRKYKFDFAKFWNSSPKGVFQEFKNDSVWIRK